MTSMAKGPKQHPLLRNLQFSPIKEERAVRRALGPERLSPRKNSSFR